jgi:hypothetical protein
MCGKLGSSLGGKVDECTISGRGQNQFGHFELLGKYNLTTKTLRCSKYYLASIPLRVKRSRSGGRGGGIMSPEATRSSGRRRTKNKRYSGELELSSSENNNSGASSSDDSDANTSLASMAAGEGGARRASRKRGRGGSSGAGGGGEEKGPKKRVRVRNRSSSSAISLQQRLRAERDRIRSAEREAERRRQRKAEKAERARLLALEKSQFHRPRVVGWQWASMSSLQSGKGSGGGGHVRCEIYEGETGQITWKQAAGCGSGRSRSGRSGASHHAGVGGSNAPVLLLRTLTPNPAVDDGGPASVSHVEPLQLTGVPRRAVLDEMRLKLEQAQLEPRTRGKWKRLASGGCWSARLPVPGAAPTGASGSASSSTTQAARKRIVDVPGASGNWAEGVAQLRHGHGVAIYPNGLMYEGESLCTVTFYANLAHSLTRSP